MVFGTNAAMPLALIIFLCTFGAMRYIWAHIRAIIDAYNGSLPLPHYLKEYYKRYPKLGSRDRRMLNDMAFSWYRCSKGLINVDINKFEGNVKACLLLCNFKKTLNYLESNYEVAAIDFDYERLFPQEVIFSMGITRAQWLHTLLGQPALFIRIRKNKPEIVRLLEEQHIPYQTINDACISLPNGTKTDTLLPAASYVIQDASSQQACAFFQPVKNEYWYDCCSGAGGKSLWLKDKEPSLKLTVSDIRKNILHNLKERFNLYKHIQPTAYIIDATDKLALATALSNAQFDNIICDVPCSGSGTWARAPEQLYFFDAGKQQNFPALQAKIAANAAQYLKPGGKLYYITCSVFKAENEGVVEEIILNTGLKLIESQLINGISNKADSLYVAVLGKDALL